MNITDIKRANKKAGKFFFSPDTMKFFGSRIESKVYEGRGGIYFVTSEQPPHGKRIFNVRRFQKETADIEFSKQAITTKEKACKIAKGLAECDLAVIGTFGILGEEEAK